MQSLPNPGTQGDNRVVKGLNRPQQLSVSQAQYIRAKAYRIDVGRVGRGTPLLEFDVKSWTGCPYCVDKVYETLPTDEDIEDLNHVDGVGRLVTCVQAAWVSLGSSTPETL